MYNVLIVGAGNKGALSDAPGSGNEHKYLSYGHAVTDHPGFEIFAFEDTEYGKVEAAKAMWPCKASDIPDVLIIASSDASHYQALRIALSYPYKLVICEKPLCMDVRQADEIVNLYKQRGIPLMVDYTRRFIPQWREHKRAIDAGEYGKLVHGYGVFNDSYMDDAPILEKRNKAYFHTGSHMIDTALWLTGRANFDFQYIPTHYKWLYQWMFCFEKSHVGEMMGDFTKEKVNTIYDPHLKYVMDNAYQFLEGKEELLCTGEDALRALEETYKFMEATECELH